MVSILCFRANSDKEGCTSIAVYFLSVLVVLYAQKDDAPQKIFVNAHLSLHRVTNNPFLYSAFAPVAV